MTQKLQHKIYELLKIYALPKLRYDNDLMNVLSSVWDVYQRKATGEDYRYKVLEMIDEKVREIFDNLDLLTYLRATDAYGGKPLFHTLFNLIDSANYWGDKKTAHSNVARLYDAAHAYFAQVCDVLVTNDKRMRAKTKAVYSFLGVKTKVVSTNEYLGI